MQIVKCFMYLSLVFSAAVTCVRGYKLSTSYSAMINNYNEQFVKVLYLDLHLTQTQLNYDAIKLVAGMLVYSNICRIQ